MGKGARARGPAAIDVGVTTSADVRTTPSVERDRDPPLGLMSQRRVESLVRSGVLMRTMIGAGICTILLKGLITLVIKMQLNICVRLALKRYSN